MPRDSKAVARDISTLWPELVLLGFILSMAFVYIRFCSTRYFNFDEFEVLYAGASLLRGKAFYADQIEPHFPLFNMCIAFLIAVFGFTTTTVFIARYFILAINVVSLIFIYKIGERLWSKRAGLVAAFFTLSSIVFFTKGIEIRHDVFNMAFNVIGAYYGLRYVLENRMRFLVLSGTFLGIALASTQKAMVWNIGIIIGLWMYCVRDKSYRALVTMSSWYLITLLAPLVIAISYLVAWHGEDLSLFLKHAVATQVAFYAPITKEIYPFPYSRYELFKDLIFQNHLLYALGIGGVFAILIVWFRSNTERVILSLWALTGVVFYVTAKRPFFQSFLPSIPPLSLLAAGFLFEMINDFKAMSLHKRIGSAVVAMALLFIWPLGIVYSKAPDNPKMMRQMANVSFCLKNLKDDEKVLCFTQNQIFFDPVFKINWEVGGKPIWDYDATWFEERMIAEQCKVIINDYRTRLLNKEVRKKIGLNYITIKTGDILVPGFVIGPRQLCTRKVWIAGDYYSPTTSLEIDGNKMRSNLMYLEQKEYAFHNLTDRRVALVYIFDKTKIMNHLSTTNRIR